MAEEHEPTSTTPIVVFRSSCGFNVKPFNAYAFLVNQVVHARRSLDGHQLYVGVLSDRSASLADEVRRLYPGAEPRPPLLPVNHYHPRIHRGPEGAHFLGGLEGLSAAQVSAARLFSAFAEILATIQPDRRNAECFGLNLRLLLIQACTEVEAAWKGILKANSYPGERWTTNDYVKLLPVLRLSEWKLQLGAYADWDDLAPFETWDSTRPTTSLPWYDAYNAVKHDPVDKLHRATLANVVSAMASLQILIFAQYGPKTLDALTIPHYARLLVSHYPDFGPEEVYYATRGAPVSQFKAQPYPWP